MPFYTQPLKLYRDGQKNGPDPAEYPYSWQHRAAMLGDEPDDMNWLRTVYGAPTDIRFAVLYGNEDSAIRIEGWYDHNPENGIPPDWTYDSPKKD